MNSKQFKIRMIELDVNNRQLAEKLGVNIRTIQKMLASDKIPLLYQWALYGLELELNKQLTEKSE